MSKIFANIFLFIVGAFFTTGCSVIQETLASQVEVPTLEIQANRVAIGMTLVRENNILENKMPISSDAKWPSLIAQDLNKTQKQLISNLLMQDPYYATVHYSTLIQRKILGSSALVNQLGDYGHFAAALVDQSISPLAYEAFGKIVILYGNNPKNWPKVFDFSASVSNMLEFNSGKMKEIDSPEGDVYENLHKAVISLAPVNLQKDLQTAKNESEDADNDVLYLKAEIGKIKTQIESNKGKKREEKLSRSEIQNLQEELALKEEELKNAESLANEKQAIYFELLDQIPVALENGVDVNDKEYGKLARNINIVAKEIDSSATEAYGAFSIALTSIVTNNILAKLPQELYSLALAKANVPANLQSKYNERILRIVKNSLVLLPNVFVGIYYAHKQSQVAKKYEDITEEILEIYDVYEEQNKEMKDSEKS